MRGVEMEIYYNKFVPVNSFASAAFLVSLAVVAFALSFAVVPFMQWQLHFFQAAVFASAFVFGPFAGAAVGALASSWSGLIVLHNPYILAGNAILGFAAAYFYTRMHPLKAAMAAYAVQLPWLVATDVFLVGMPGIVVAGIALTLLAENLVCGAIAMSVAPRIRALIGAT